MCVSHHATFRHLMILRGDNGNVSLEYVFLALLIVLALILGVTFVGQETKDNLADPEFDSAFNQ